MLSHLKTDCETDGSFHSTNQELGHSSARAAALVLHLKLYLNVNERLWLVVNHSISYNVPSMFLFHAMFPIKCRHNVNMRRAWSTHSAIRNPVESSNCIEALGVSWNLHFCSSIFAYWSLKVISHTLALLASIKSNDSKVFTYSMLYVGKKW